MKLETRDRARHWLGFKPGARSATRGDMAMFSAQLASIPRHNPGHNQDANFGACPAPLGAGLERPTDGVQCLCRSHGNRIDYSGNRVSARIGPRSTIVRQLRTVFVGSSDQTVQRCAMTAQGRARHWLITSSGTVAVRRFRSGRSDLVASLDSDVRCRTPPRSPRPIASLRPR